jgi:hypothetical protein
VLFDQRIIYARYASALSDEWRQRFENYPPASIEQPVLLRRRAA